VLDNTDCDDNAISIHGPTTLYQDVDNDGLGNPLNFASLCPGTAGYVQNSNDCDDSNPDIGEA